MHLNYQSVNITMW